MTIINGNFTIHGLYTEYKTTNPQNTAQYHKSFSFNNTTDLNVGGFHGAEEQFRISCDKAIKVEANSMLAANKISLICKTEIWLGIGAAESLPLILYADEIEIETPVLVVGEIDFLQLPATIKCTCQKLLLAKRSGASDPYSFGVAKKWAPNAEVQNVTING